MRTDRSFDRVLAEAQEQERTRLRRYRRRWILRQLAVLLVASAVVASCAPALFEETELAPWSAVAGFLVGGWIGFVALIGLMGVATLAILLALVRLAAVLRTDDVAAFERTHAPWWSDAPR